MEAVLELPDKAAVVLADGMAPIPTDYACKDLPGAKFGHLYSRTHDLKIHLFKPTKTAKVPAQLRESGALYIEHQIAGLSKFYRCTYAPITFSPQPLFNLPEWVLHSAVTCMLAASAHGASEKERDLYTAIHEAANLGKLKIRKKRNQQKVSVRFYPTPPECEIVEYQAGYAALAVARLSTQIFNYPFPCRATREAADNDWATRHQDAGYVQWEAKHRKRALEVKPSSAATSVAAATRKPAKNSIFRAYR